MKLKIKNALVSVSDKENLTSLLKTFKKYKIDIISSGGTFNSIKKLGYKCTELSRYTGFKEMLDGRVKTLHPKIHAGILHDRQNKTHKSEMNKKKFAIIGNPIGHSLSPILHNYWFKKYKINAEYSLLEIKEDEIKNVIEKIRNKIIHGVNVTLPYKQKVIALLDQHINDAKESGSVNTIYLNEEKKVVGENTDVFGLQAAYLKEVDEISKKKALVLEQEGCHLL